MKAAAHRINAARLMLSSLMTGDVVITDDVKDQAPQEKVQYAKSGYQNTNGARMCEKLECKIEWNIGKTEVLACPNDVTSEEK